MPKSVLRLLLPTVASMVILIFFQNCGEVNLLDPASETPPPPPTTLVILGPPVTVPTPELVQNPPTTHGPNTTAIPGTGLAGVSCNFGQEGDPLFSVDNPPPPRIAEAAIPNRCFDKIDYLIENSKLYVLDQNNSSRRISRSLDLTTASALNICAIDTGFQKNTFYSMGFIPKEDIPELVNNPVPNGVKVDPATGIEHRFWAPGLFGVMFSIGGPTETRKNPQQTFSECPGDFGVNENVTPRPFTGDYSIVRKPFDMQNMKGHCGLSVNPDNTPTNSQAGIRAVIVPDDKFESFPYPANFLDMGPDICIIKASTRYFINVIHGKQNDVFTSTCPYSFCSITFVRWM